MYLKQNHKIEKINSVSDCFNDLLDDLHKKKSFINGKKYENYLRKNNFDSPLEEKQCKFQGLSFEKIIHQQNFDKKCTQILNALNLSPKRLEIESPNKKNYLLWDLKIKKDGNASRDQSLKRLGDFRLRMVYNQDIDIPEEQKLLENFLNVKTANFKQSNSSDFFKSTINSDSKTFYTSKNSFYNSANNFNKTLKFNSANNFYSGSNNEANKPENNLSFNSYKSFSSFGNQSIKNNNKNTKKKELDSTIFSFNNNNSNNKNEFVGMDFIKSKEKSQRVNFDNFNSIGENPFKINIYDTHSQINSERKKVNLKNSVLLMSPKNIYSPNRNRLTYYTNKHKQIIDVDQIFSGGVKDLNIKSSKSIFDLKITDVNRIDAKSKINLSPKYKINSKEKNSNNLDSKDLDYKNNRISTTFMNNRHITFKKIDNLLNNFSTKSSFLSKNDKNKKVVL